MVMDMQHAWVAFRSEYPSSDRRRIVLRKLAAGKPRRSWGFRTGGEHEKGPERLEDTLRPAARPEATYQAYAGPPP
jgi:hypothetical protein